MHMHVIQYTHNEIFSSDCLYRNILLMFVENRPQGPYRKGFLTDQREREVNRSGRNRGVGRVRAVAQVHGAPMETRLRLQETSCSGFAGSSLVVTMPARVTQLAFLPGKEESMPSLHCQAELTMVWRDGPWSRKPR